MAVIDDREMDRWTKLREDELLAFPANSRHAAYTAMLDVAMEWNARSGPPLPAGWTSTGSAFTTSSVLLAVVVLLLRDGPLLASVLSHAVNFACSVLDWIHRHFISV